MRFMSALVILSRERQQLADVSTSSRCRTQSSLCGTTHALPCLHLRKVVEGAGLFGGLLVGIRPGLLLLRLLLRVRGLVLCLLGHLPLDGGPEDGAGRRERESLETPEQVGAAAPLEVTGLHVVPLQD